MKHFDERSIIMAQNENHKNDVTEKLRTGSKYLWFAFAAGTLLSAVWCIRQLISLIAEQGRAAISSWYVPRWTAYTSIQHICEAGFLTAMLLIAALMFRRIAKSGVPFEHKTIRAVRIIGILCMMQAFVSHLAASLLTMSMQFALIDLFPMQIIAEGLLFLFAAKMMKYGAMLQIESDETL